MVSSLGENSAALTSAGPMIVFPVYLFKRNSAPLKAA
jgi:hypothetical protein